MIFVSFIFCDCCCCSRDLFFGHTEQKFTFLSHRWHNQTLSVRNSFALILSFFPFLFLRERVSCISFSPVMLSFFGFGSFQFESQCLVCISLRCFLWSGSRSCVYSVVPFLVRARLSSAVLRTEATQ